MFRKVFGNRRECVVVNDVEALERVLIEQPRTPILFTENGQDFIRISPRAEHREPMRGSAGIWGWFRDLVGLLRNVMGPIEGKTANVA